MRPYLLILLTTFSLLFLQPAFAINLEVTQGFNKATPIAVVPFSGASNPIAEVVAQDLQNSGLFTVTDFSKLPQQASDINQVQFDDWRKLPVNDLLIGNITPLSNGNYKVNFMLLDVFKSQQSLHFNSLSEAVANPQLNPIIIQESFTVTQAALRQLGHHISDLIYRRITGQPGVFETKLAYVLVQRSIAQPTKYILEVADSDGYNAQPLLTSTQPIMSPSWSPNGKQIAYVSFENHHSAIYISTLATGQRQQISAYPGINGAPRFSPDGKQLALALSMGKGNPNIYLLNLSNKKLTQLTQDNFINTEPSWSADGKNIVFTSDRHHGPQIIELNLLTKKNTPLTTKGDYNATASLTPNGQNLVMLHRDEEGYAIAVEDLQTQVLQILTSGGYDQSPSLAPNGNLIVYTQYQQGRDALAMVSLNGHVQVSLPTPTGNAQTPSWGPLTN